MVIGWEEDRLTAADHSSEARAVIGLRYNHPGKPHGRVFRTNTAPQLLEGAVGRDQRVANEAGWQFAERFLGRATRGGKLAHAHGFLSGRVVEHDFGRYAERMAARLAEWVAERFLDARAPAVYPERHRFGDGCVAFFAGGFCRGRFAALDFRHIYGGVVRCGRDRHVQRDRWVGVARC